MKLPMMFFRDDSGCSTLRRIRHAMQFAVLLLLTNINPAAATESISAVDAIGITVGDMRRSLDFTKSQIIQVPATGSSFNRGLMARDPDGHALIFTAH